MPFEAADTMMGPVKQMKAGVRYMRNWAKKKGEKEGRPSAAPPKLLITMPTAIFICTSEKALLLVGTGDDEGKFRVKGAAKTAKGAAKIVTFKGHVMIRFGHVKQLGDEIFDLTYYDIKKISQDEYELTPPPPEQESE